MAHQLQPFWATSAVAVVTVLLPYVAPGVLLGLTPLPGTMLVTIGGIALLYALASELARRVFYRSVAL